MNNKVLDKVDEIIEFIKETEEYKDYLYLKDKLEKNEKALSLINEIKKYQKELVKKEVEKLDTKDLEDKINNNLKELDNIPLYNEYLDVQEKLNDMYQLVKKELDNYFYNKLN